MTTACDTSLADQIRAALDQRDDEVFSFGLTWPDVAPTHLRAFEALPDLSAIRTPQQRAALAVALHPARTGDGLDPRYEALLATLRDRIAARVLAAVPLREDAHDALHVDEALRALGFATSVASAHDGAALRVARFDLDRYKPTPTWLNPSRWANPENWNRFRW